MFTRADGDAAAARLGAEHQGIVERLITLEDHLGRRLLDGTALEGVTRERRTEVLEDLARLWALHEIYSSAVQRVRAIMGGRSRPTHAELDEVAGLVTGPAVILPNPDGSGSARQVTLSALAAEIRSEHARVHEVLTAVEAVWTELSSRFDRCDALLAQSRTLAADLGLSAERDQAVVVLGQLAGELDTVRRTALTDPLSRWAGHSVQATDADRLIARCEAALSELHALDELRRHAQRRLDGVGATLNDMRGLVEQISQARHRIEAKIFTVPGPEAAAGLMDAVSARLRAAVQLCRHGRWQRLAMELPALEQDSSAALAQAQAELAHADQPLQERAELRGRLSAYRAKAAQLGLIEDLAVAHRYQRAHDLLWRAPCDLALAAVAVTEYQDAVNGTLDGEERGWRSEL